MSKLDELINELCPDGVEYVEFDSVLDYEQPTKYIVETTNYDDRFETPVLTAGQTFILGYTNETDGIYIASKENSTIIFDDFTTSLHWVDFSFKIKSSAMKMLKVKPHKVNDTILRYVYHCMKNIQYEPVDHSRQWITKYSALLFPLPPLPVQEEIVRILDNFAMLTAGLIAEISAEFEARKKQYEYYRDSLFSYPNISYEPLSTLADIGTGSSNTNEGLEVGDYPFFVRSQEVRRKNEFQFDETAIITSGDGVGVGKIYHYVEGKYALHQRAYRIHITSDRLIPKFFFHYMKSSFLKYIEKNAVNSSVTSVRRPMMDKYPVPVPPFPEQQRIVAILDRFDALYNDISSGLPTEINARQQQYEYYRDKLLTFPKAELEV